MPRAASTNTPSAASTTTPQIAADVAAMHERVRDGRYAGTATTFLTQQDENYNQVPYSTFQYAWMMYKPNRNSRTPSDIDARLHMLVGWTATGDEIYALVANNDNCQYCIVQYGSRTDVRRSIPGNKIQVWTAGLRDGDFVPRKGNSTSAILTARGEIIKRALKQEATVQFKNNTKPSVSHNDQLQNAVELAIQAAVDASVALPAVAGPVPTLDATFPADFSTFTANQFSVTIPNNNLAVPNNNLWISGVNSADVTLLNGAQPSYTIPETVPTASATLENPQVEEFGPKFFKLHDTPIGILNMDADAQVDYTQIDNLQPNVTDPAALLCDGPLPNGAQADFTELHVMSSADIELGNPRFDFTGVKPFAFDSTLLDSLMSDFNPVDGTLLDGAQPDFTTELHVMTSADHELGNSQPNLRAADQSAFDSTLPDISMSEFNPDDYTQPTVAEPELENPQFDSTEAIAAPFDGILPDDLTFGFNPVECAQPTVAESVVAEPVVAEPAVAEFVAEPVNVQNDRILDDPIPPADTNPFSSMIKDDDDGIISAEDMAYCRREFAGFYGDDSDPFDYMLE